MPSFVLPTPIGGTASGGGGDGSPGPAGKSAYQLAVQQGFEGTLAEWLESLHGADGTPGVDGTDGSDGLGGKSAYQLAVDGGFLGTEVQWISSLKGDPGAKGDKGDAGAKGADGLDGSNYYVLGMGSVTIPGTINAIRVGGYYAPGDGGSGLFKRVGSQPSHAGKFQGADGAWWELSFTGEVHVAQFGGKPEAAFNNATAINNATTYLVAMGGGVINYSAGTYFVGAEVTVKSRIGHKGVGRRVTYVKRLAAYLGDMFKTQDFDTLNAGDTAGGPNRFSVEDMTLHGDKDNASNASATGWCLRIYGRAYVIRNVDIEYCPAGGFYSRWGTTSAAWDDDTTDSVMESLIDGLFVQFVKGTPIFDGPHDSQVSRMIVAMARHNQSFLSGSSSFEIGTRSGGTQFTSLHVWGAFPEWCVTNRGNAISITDLVLDDAASGGGLLKQIGSECFIQGRGIQYGTESIKGLQIGETGTVCKGNKISLVLTCTPAAVIAFGNDGGNDLDITVNAPVSTTNFTGTRHADTTLKYAERGAGAGANDYVNIFGALTVNKQTVAILARSGTPTDVAWVEGLVYYDTSTHKLRVFNGTSWADCN
jgi:hypothetical protein